MGRLLALLILAFPVQASFTNGSFEHGVNPGAFLEVNNSAFINAWIGHTAVDYVGTLWEASDGNRSIDLNASAPGRLQQLISTKPLTTYLVRFDLAGNPLGLQGIKTVRVTAAVTLADYTFDTTGRDVDDMGWEEKTFQFTANASNSLLQFVSLTGGQFGPAIDNVRFSVVPAPPALILLGSALLFGLGFIARRK